MLNKHSPSEIYILHCHKAKPLFQVFHRTDVIYEITTEAFSNYFIHILLNILYQCYKNNPSNTSSTVSQNKTSNSSQKQIEKKKVKRAYQEFSNTFTKSKLNDELFFSRPTQSGNFCQWNQQK